MKFKWKNKNWLKITFGILLLFLCIIWFFSLPSPLFDSPYSTALFSNQHNLMGARVASDGQWRFPPVDSVPSKFEACILQYEDQRFYSHPGIDPFAIGRAIVDNIKAGEVVSGASTLSMQVIRLSRNRERTIGQKLIEMAMATQLELRYSKKEILNLYASHAPFGGNVVGLAAASWRYFGKAPTQLSWGESATLAVLPNTPALIHPGRNREQLLKKRNRLLLQLMQEKVIDSITYSLSKAEDIPQAPLPLPDLAPHLTEHCRTHNVPTPVNSTLSAYLQSECAQILKHHQMKLNGIGVYNAAILIIENKTGNILAYHGNMPDCGNINQQHVDIVQAPRSSGSLLKPFLFAHALEEGSLLPTSLLPDLPTSLQGYQPKNYKQEFDGRVPADKALQRSLNLPFVHLLKEFGYPRFYDELKKWPLTTLEQAADHYGLALILGGAEVTLWDMVAAYSTMGNIAHEYVNNSSRYKQDFNVKLKFEQTRNEAEPNRKDLLRQAPLLSAGAAYLTLDILKDLERPDEQSGWEYFNSHSKFAWKTGTSIGFRDAWTIGVNPKFTVGVWVGNADGEGKHGLVGFKTAAPIFFDVVQLLDNSTWFDPAYDDLREVMVCRESGYLASSICPVDTTLIPAYAHPAKPCRFHREIWISKLSGQRLQGQCLQREDAIKDTVFHLSPTEAYYYSKQHPSYISMPEPDPMCSTASDLAMEWIYPRDTKTILLSRNESGRLTPVIFEIAHQYHSKKVHWHLNGHYVQTTKGRHSLSCIPEKGPLTLSVTDEDGQQLTHRSKIIYEGSKTQR